MSANWHDLIGRDVVAVDIHTDEVIIETSTLSIRAYHCRECCEDFRFIKCDGDIGSLFGTVKVAEEDGGASAPDEFRSMVVDDSHTWTKLTIATASATVHFWFLGQSNGYYGESVDFQELTKEQVDDIRREFFKTYRTP